MAKEFIVTESGLLKLRTELKHLKDVRFKEIAMRLKEARELGDLSENAEYEEAKNEQAFVSGRAIELEQMIKNAKIIKNVTSCGGKVAVGCKVTVSVGKDQESYTIVGQSESDPLNGFISADSPIGRSLVGASVGDTVRVNAPAGIITYKIVKID